MSKRNVSQQVDILPEQKFYDLSQNAGLNLFPITPIDRNSFSFLLSLSEEDFIKYASTHGKDVYYYYRYPEEHEIIITGKTFDEAPQEILRMIDDLEINPDFNWFLDEYIYPDTSVETEDDEPINSDSWFGNFEKELLSIILKHNDSVDRSIQTQAYEFGAFCIVHGCIIGIFKSIQKPTKAFSDLYSILFDYKEIAMAKLEAKKQELELFQNKLHDQLMSDQEFQLSTNKKLRDDFAWRLWKKTDSSWIRSLFSQNGNPNYQEYHAFVERVYNEYKIYGKTTRLDA